MASVNVYSVEKVDEILNGAVVGASIDAGHLILELGDGSTVDVGSVISALGDASDTVKGVVELATDTETITGTDSVRAVTPLSLAALTATDARKGLVELATYAEAVAGTDQTRAVTPLGLASKQPLDNDLTAIAGLTPANDDIIQRKSSNWVNRTLAQFIADLQATGEFLELNLHNGTAYADTDSTKIYIGPTDPGAVANGSIWFDTTGA